MSAIADTPPGGRVARRRAQVRQRILDVAESLMTARGVEAVTIDEIADAADIARRSFYHHFASKNDALVPIARARTRSLNRRIDRLIAEIEDPAAVMATAMRHALRAITRDPLVRWFVLSSGLPQQRLQEGLGASGERDALLGLERGRFQFQNPRVVHLLLAGAFVAVLGARAEKTLEDDDLDDAVEHMLRMLGVALDEAHDVAHLPLPPLPAERRSDRAS